jgi:hypothetical protein
LRNTSVIIKPLPAIIICNIRGREAGMNRILVLILFCVIIIGSSCSRYDFDDRRYDSRFDRRFDPRYDRNFYDRMRYYRFPFCDRYGRCENPIWWMFWPFFFL